jgi:hypothetical protein
MLRAPFRTVCTSALICTAAIVLLGCEHEAARDQVATDTALRQAENALFSAGMDSDKLERVVSTIKSIRSGSKQQQANRDLMLASAEIRFGQSRIQNLNELELQLRHDIEHVSALADGVHALQSFIDGRKITIGQLGNDDLQKQSEELTTTIAALRRQLSDMQGPVQAVRTQNEDQGSRVLDLRRAAESLRQEQMELGPLDGFEVFKRAIIAEDEANLLELEIAQRQVVMELDTEPIIEQTTLARDHVQDHIDEVNDAQQALANLVDTHHEQAEAARRLIDRMNSSINAAMRSLNEQESTALQAGYDSIRGAFDAAASSARSGQRAIMKDGKGPAALLQSQSNMLLFQIDAHMIRGLQERIGLLGQLSDSDIFSNRDNYELQLKKSNEKLEQLKTSAKSAGEAAIQALGGVRNGSVDQVRTELQAAMAALGIETKIAAAPSQPTPPPAAPAPAPASAATAGTYATPQALVEYINSIISSNEPVADKLRAAQAVNFSTTPDAKRGMEMQFTFLTAFQNLENAATQKFGSTSSSMMITQIQTQMNHVISRMDLSTLKMTSDTTAEISVSQPMGPPITGYLIKAPDRGWLINEDENYVRNPSLKGALQMVPTLIKAFNDVTAQIKAGTITNPMGIDMAIGQAMGGGG